MLYFWDKNRGQGEESKIKKKVPRISLFEPTKSPALPRIRSSRAHVT